MDQEGNSLLEETSALWYKLMHGPLYKPDPSPVVSRTRELVQHRAKVAKHDFLRYGQGEAKRKDRNTVPTRPAILPCQRQCSKDGEHCHRGNTDN